MGVLDFFKKATSPLSRRFVPTGGDDEEENGDDD